MNSTPCDSCRKPKSGFECEMCESALCKNCAQILDQDTFSFLAEIPETLKHTTYCPQCFDENVAPELETYREVMQRAEEVFVFFTSQRKEIPLIKRSKLSFSVKDNIDRDQTILRLAFFAAKEGYNAITEVEVISEKVRNGAYQTSKWRGTGVPAQIDADKLAKQDAQDQVYR